MSSSRHPHPVDRPALPILMLAFVVLAALGASGWNGDGGRFQPWAAVMAVVSAASFVVLLAIYWTGWVVRGHMLWLEERANSGDEPSTG